MSKYILENELIKTDNLDGFYNYPFDDNISVSKNGKIFNKFRNNLITQRLNYKGYKTIKCSYGHYDYKTYISHRLLAITFIKRPEHHKNTPYEKLQVNHINGIKDDNRLENLEWVNNQENVQHAVDTGLATYAIPILAKDVRNDIIERYASVAACANKYNLNQTKLREHINSDQYGTVTKDWHVFKLDNGTKWPELSKKQICEDAWTRVIPVWYFRNIETDEVFIFRDMQEAAQLLGYENFESLRSSLRCINNHKRNKDWLFNYGICPTIEDTKWVRDNKVNIGYYRNQVNVLNTSTNENKIFENLAETAKYLNIPYKTLIYILTDKDGKFNEFIITEPYKIETEKSIRKANLLKEARKSYTTSEKTKDKLRQSAKKQYAEMIVDNVNGRFKSRKQ